MVVEQSAKIHNIKSAVTVNQRFEGAARLAKSPIETMGGWWGLWGRLRGGKPTITVAPATSIPYTKVYRTGRGGCFPFV